MGAAGAVRSANASGARRSFRPPRTGRRVWLIYSLGAVAISSSKRAVRLGLAFAAAVKS